MSRLGFVGLGAMGSRMARRLVDAGHEVLVWNRTAERAKPLGDAGATLVASPAKAAEGAEAVISMVADPAALRTVTEGAHGIAGGIGSATMIEMSTVGPKTIAWLASALPSSATLLDAPVLGSLSEAEQGTLRIFAGGPEAAVRAWTPVLRVMGSPSFVGPSGSGAAAKLVANAALIAALTGLGESLALAAALGLPAEVALDVLSSTPLAAQAERRRASVLGGEYPKRFALSLGLKDANLIDDAGREGGFSSRVFRAAREWFAQANDAGLGEHDYAEIIAWMLRSIKTDTP